MTVSRGRRFEHLTMTVGSFLLGTARPVVCHVTRYDRWTVWFRDESNVVHCVPRLIFERDHVGQWLPTTTTERQDTP